MSDTAPHPPVVNVTPPPQDPDATKKMFDELLDRTQWMHYGSDKGKLLQGPPSEPPPPPEQPIDKEEPSGDDDLPVHGTFPVPDITNEQYKEYALEPEDTSCWKCGAKEGARKIPENGAWLCANCEGIMKP